MYFFKLNKNKIGKLLYPKPASWYDGQAVEAYSMIYIPKFLILILPTFSSYSHSLFYDLMELDLL